MGNTRYIFFANISFGLLQSSCYKFTFTLFRRKKFFERSLFISVFGIFSPFLKLARFQICTVGVLYNTSVECHRGCGSEAGGNGFHARYRPIFLRLFSYSLTCSSFSTGKCKNKGFLVKNSNDFVEGSFLLKSEHFSDITETNGLFSKFFQSLRKIFVFPEKPKKKQIR